MGRSRSRLVTILPSLVDIDTVVAEVFLVCQVILQDHVTKGYSKIMGRGRLRLVTILTSLVALGTVTTTVRCFKIVM